MLKPLNPTEKIELTPFMPRKDIILITGTISFMGIELFCGSVVYDNKDGLEFKPCQVIAPDLGLYNQLQKHEVGTILKIEKQKIEGRKIKAIYTTETLTTADPKAQEQIKEQVAEFDPTYYEGKQIII